MTVGLQNHVDVDLFLGKQAEYLVGNARHVRHCGKGNARDLFILRHTGDISLFHVLDYLLDNRTGISGKAGQNLQLHTIALGELYRAVIEDLRAERRQLQHFVIRNFGQLLCLRHNARIAGINAVDVREDLAQIRLQGNRHRNRRRIRAAASERRHIAVFVHALEARDKDDALFVQLLLHALARDLLDAGERVGRRRVHADLPAAKRHNRIAQLFNCHRHQRNRHLLAAGKQHIHLALRGVGVNLLRLGNQIVRGVALRGQHHAHFVALCVGVRDDFCHAEDALCVCN